LQDTASSFSSAGRIEQPPIEHRDNKLLFLIESRNLRFFLILINFMFHQQNKHTKIPNIA